MSAFFKWVFVEALRFIVAFGAALGLGNALGSSMGLPAFLLAMLVWFAFFCRGTKRAFRIGEGVSEERFVDGRPRLWRFKSRELTLEADFDANTLRVISPRCQRKKAIAGVEEVIQRCAVDLVWPLDSCAFGVCEQEKLRTYSNQQTTMATGTGWVDGQAVTVTAPVTVNTGGGGTYMAKTGKFDVNVWVHLSPRSVYRAGCHRFGDGFKSYSNIRRVNFDQDAVALAGVSRSFGAWAERETEPFRKRLAELSAAKDKECLDEDHRLAVEELLKTEQERKDQAEAVRREAQAMEDAAKANAAELIRQAGLPESSQRSHLRYSDGAIRQLLACDRQSKLLIVSEGRSWCGSVAGAKASLTPAEGDDAIEIELLDKDYERQHLAKPRFNLRMESREVARQWVDMVNILGESA
ncbi:MAG: hypothetical protein QM702_11935 [Rubrivivax sp.]